MYVGSCTKDVPIASALFDGDSGTREVPPRRRLRVGHTLGVGCLWDTWDESWREKPRELGLYVNLGPNLEKYPSASDSEPCLLSLSYSCYNSTST
jgi:hypothetical protein